MFRLSVTHHTKGKDPIPWIREVTGIAFVRMEGALADAADECVNNMIRIIEDNRRHPARPGISKLQNSINWEEVLNIPGKELRIGIGNIAKMTQEAPYWELINAGGTYITKETHVVPTHFFASPESDFVTFKAGSSHTIEPMRYVEIAEEQLRAHIEKEITRLIKEIK